jgi:hypothetical protein
MHEWQIVLSKVGLEGFVPFWGHDPNVRGIHCFLQGDNQMLQSSMSIEHWTDHRTSCWLDGHESFQ